MSNKYGAKPTTIMYAGKEVRCASRAEAKRFGELILLQRARKIYDLQFHPRYPLYAAAHPAQKQPRKKVADYVADAAYGESLPDGELHVVEEIKGHETAVWKLKRKLFEACHPYATLKVIRA